MVGHIKDLHNDLIFHCEVCDDYKAREDLMAHMLGHVLNPTNETPTITTELEKEPKSAPNDPQTANVNGASQMEKTTPKSSTNDNHQPEPIKKHYCADCDKVFADSGGFKYHINSFHRKISKYKSTKHSEYTKNNSSISAVHESFLGFLFLNAFY